MGVFWGCFGGRAKIFLTNIFVEDFLKSPFSASLSRGNLVDGLPRGVSTEAMSASWIFWGGALNGEHDLLRPMF